MAPRAWVRTRRDDGLLRLDCGGEWLVGEAAALDAALRRIEPAGAERAALDLAGIEALDSAGAWLIARSEARLAAKGLATTIENAPERILPLLRQAAAVAAAPPPRPRRPRQLDLRAFLNLLGQGVVHALLIGRDLLGFFGIVCIVALRTLRRPSRFRLVPLISQMQHTGTGALPIVGLLSFLIGVVFAYQGADQLRAFGAEIYTVNLLAIAILREVGVLLTAILVAGRSGSAFTAEIGTMQVNEEVDALRTLGLDPIEVLVLPRILALTLVLPLLVFYANAMALLGGAVMCWAVLDISLPAFLAQFEQSLIGWTFWLGLIKAPAFALLIALTGCFEGFRVTRSAESVGRQTTASVVEAIFLVIIADAAFSILFSYLRL